MGRLLRTAARAAELLTPREPVPCPTCGRIVMVLPEVLACADGPWFVERPEGEVTRECERRHGAHRSGSDRVFVTV